MGQSLFEEINRHLESRDCGFGRERSWTLASLRRHRRRRIVQVSETLRCVRRRRGMSGIFGMKVHIGADAETGVIHSVRTTRANVHDVTEAHRLLHGGERSGLGADAGYQGVDKRLENRELDVDWQVAMRPGRRRQLEPGSYEALMEKQKASTRAKVEHPFLYREAALWLRQGALPRAGKETHNG